MSQSVNQPSEDEADNKSRAQEPAAIRQLTSAELLKGDREIAIRHRDEIYRLRVTRKGKLILYK